MTLSFLVTKRKKTQEGYGQLSQSSTSICLKFWVKCYLILNYVVDQHYLSYIKHHWYRTSARSYNIFGFFLLSQWNRVIALFILLIPLSYFVCIKYSLMLLYNNTYIFGILKFLCVEISLGKGSLFSVLLFLPQFWIQCWST